MKNLKLILFILSCMIIFSCKKDESNNTSTLTDIDGNTYNTVTLGSQVWMKENLKTRNYNNGTPITIVTDSSSWMSLSTEAWCYYKNDATNNNVYGKIYNWYAVGTGILCPKGWHVPSDDEWSTLEIYLENHEFNYDGTIDTDNDRFSNNKISKSLAATTLWSNCAEVGTIGYSLATNNSTGFSALPGGYRGNLGLFYNELLSSCWWTSTVYGTTYASYRNLYYNSTTMGKNQYYKQAGFYVRCLKD